jgi:endonuclease YncB( thermonuclease family)
MKPSVKAVLGLTIVFASFAFSGGSSAHPGGLDQEGCHDNKKAAEHHCHPERLIARALSTCELKKPPKAGDEGVFFGRFVRAIDGDTFEAKVQGVVMDFRLAEADAPEKDQPYGDISMEELSSLIKHRDLVLVPIDTDRYGRTVVFVWSGSTCVNKEMVRRGAAWFYDEFSQSNVLHLIEDNARDAKRGLWRLPLNQRTEPWVWRQEKR